MPEEKEDQTAVDFSSNKLIWIAGAVILLIAGYFGLKTLFASMENFRLTLVNAPKEVNIGSTTTFTWKIEGSPAFI